MKGIYMSNKEKEKEKRVIQIELGADSMDYISERLAYFSIRDDRDPQKLKEEIEKNILDGAFAREFHDCGTERRIAEHYHMDHLYSVYDHVKINDEVYDLSVEVERDGKRHDFYFNNDRDTEKEIKVVLYQDGESVSADATEELFEALDDIASGKIKKYAFFYGGDYVCNRIHPTSAVNGISGKEIG